MKINELLKVKKEAYEEIGIPYDLYFRDMLQYEWATFEKDGLYFFRYYLDKNTDKYSEQVIVFNGSKPMIIEKDGFTIIVAIDCVKVAFILNSSKKIG